MQFVPKPAMADLYRELVCETYKDEAALYQTERKNLIEQITSQNNRITKAREMLLSDMLDAGDYKLIKSECEDKILRLEVKINEVAGKFSANGEDKLIMVDKALHSLKNIVYLYVRAETEGKQQIIGSFFPEKWVFDGSQHRTARINQAALLIY